MQQLGDPVSVLRLLEDRANRAILQATSGDALTANELVERCDIPQSTTYRKLNDLTKVGLLNEQIRISSGGRHEKEYETGVNRMTISIESADQSNPCSSQLVDVQIEDG